VTRHACHARSLQSGAYSKAKGQALKYAGGSWCLATAWSVVAELDLIHFDGDLAALRAKVEEHLAAVVERAPTNPDGLPRLVDKVPLQPPLITPRPNLSAHSPAPSP
jgi:hypothetical protein